MQIDKVMFLQAKGHDDNFCYGKHQLFLRLSLFEDFLTHLLELVPAIDLMEKFDAFAKAKHKQKILLHLDFHKLFVGQVLFMLLK